jgi:hypothetical protein
MTRVSSLQGATTPPGAPHHLRTPPKVRGWHAQGRGMLRTSRRSEGVRRYHLAVDRGLTVGATDGDQPASAPNSEPLERAARAARPRRRRRDLLGVWPRLTVARRSEPLLVEVRPSPGWFVETEGTPDRVVTPEGAAFMAHLSGRPQGGALQRASSATSARTERRPVALPNSRQAESSPSGETADLRRSLRLLSMRCSHRVSRACAAPGCPPLDARLATSWCNHR